MDSPRSGARPIYRLLLPGIDSDDRGQQSVCPLFFGVGCRVLRGDRWQYVVSGRNFSMNFLLLCIQSSVCVLCVLVVKKLGIISFRSFDLADAKTWFPISFLLVTVIYTGSKSLVSRGWHRLQPLADWGLS